MEEVMHPDSGVGEEKLSEVKIDGNAQEILINGDENPQGQEGNKSSEKGIPHSTHQDSHNSSKDLFEAQDKIRVLELQLQTVNEELGNFDSDKTKLKSELDLANEKLKSIGTQYEELQLEHKRMMEEMSVEEQKYNLQSVSLQEALKDLDRKHKELADTKEVFDGMTAELESSNTKIKELELRLEETASQAQKFEELSNQSSSHAESQLQRALELEKMMETEKLASNEMEYHVNKLQEELKVLHHRLEENNQVEEILTSTKMELAESLEKLEVSKSHVGELELKLSSKEASIGKLTQELDLYKISEDQMKQDKQVLESILSSVEEDLQAKIVALEEVQLKLDQEMKDRETVEGRFQNQEMQILGFQEQLVNIKVDKETLQSNLAGLSTSENELKAQLIETEARLISAEKRNLDLELQISLVEQKCAGAEKDVKELSEKSKDLSDLLRETEENHAQSRCHVQAYEDRVNQLESSLNCSYSKKSELEQELEDLAEKCAVLEEQVGVSQQRSLELHDLLQVSESKVENAEKKVTELELLLEAVKHEKQELEQHLKLTEGKRNDAEVELEQQARRVLDLTTELQELKEISQSLEVELQSANDKEKQLIEMLNVVTEERKKHEDLSNSSAGKLLQAEKLIEDLQIDLKCTQEKLGTVERGIEVSGLRENELAEKLKYAEEQLEHERKSAEQSITRYLELESLHDILVKDSERKLEAAVASFSEKDSEAKQLYDKLNSLAEQAAFYQEQATETTEKLASLMLDLEASSARLTTHESTIEELTGKLSESESKNEHSFAEIERVKKELEESQSKIKELYESLNSIHAEKEAMDSQLLCYLQNITDLTTDRSRSSEYQSQIEASIKETEAKLGEALERDVQRNSEARDLNEKFLALETQLKVHEEHANEAASFAENRKAELDDAMLKIQSLERSVEETKSRATHFENKHVDLGETNLSLSQKIAEYETKVNELEGILKAITAEKEDAYVQLQSSRKEFEDLSQQLVSQREKLQSQISSVLDENVRTNKLYQDAKEETEAVKLQLQEMQNFLEKTESSLNADLENLKAELSQKYQLQAVISELEEQLSAADTKHKEEISSVLDENGRTNKMYQDAKREIEAVKLQLQEMQNVHKETESSLNADLENLKAELSQKYQLQVVISELEQQLSAADIKHKEEISSVLNENGRTNKMYQDAKEEIEAVKIQLQEMQDVHKKTECSLNADLENLKAELSQKYQLQALISELEQQLSAADSKHKEEIENMRQATAEKDALLATKVQEYASIAQKRDGLTQKLDDLQKEYNLSQSLIAEQKESALRIQQDREYVVISSHDELETEQQRSLLLEKQVEDLKQKLETVQIQNKKVDDGIMEDNLKGLEAKSRDFEVTTKLPSKRKSKKKSGDLIVEKASASSSGAPPIREKSGINSLKFFLGIVVVSLSIGVFLGRRY